MTKRKWLILPVLALLIGGIAGCRIYNARFVTVNGARYEKDIQFLDLQYQNVSAETYDALCTALPDCEILWTPSFQGAQYPMDTRELTVSSLSAEDILALDHFPHLETIHAEACTDYENLMALSLHRPQCRVLYQIQVNGREYRQDATFARFPNADPELLKTVLPCLPKLERILLTDTLPERAAMEDLQAAFPEIQVCWQLDRFFGLLLDSGNETLDLTDIPLTDTAELEEALSWLPNVKQVILCGTGLTQAQIDLLMDAHPDITFTFDLTFETVTFRTDAEEIDLSWIKTTPSAVEALLPYCSNLKKVVMVGCGIDNELMDQLNRRYEDIKFVWQVSVGPKYVRTDITSFIPFKLYVDYFVEGELDNLKYCTDIVALDLGHQKINTIDFVAYMPNLKYLIIADTQVMDISPLEGLENLEFLEMFLIYSQDYTPLLSLKNLKDLNLAWTYGDYKIIAQMPWLERCWWGGKWHNQAYRRHL